VSDARGNALPSRVAAVRHAAIVTGAASGIGRAVASILAAEGYAVVATDIDVDGLNTLTGEASAQGWSLVSAVADVRHRMAMAQACEQARVDGRRLAAFVHCAGITWRGAMLDMPDPEYQRVIDVNLHGSYVCLTSAARAMIDQGTGGSIVAITSVNAYRPLVTQGVYSATKAAVEVLVQTLALEVGHHGIRVNAVAPGAVDTPMNPGIGERQEAFARLPVPRVGTPSDIAAAVRFLVSDAAAYITGSSLVVDGGLIRTRAI
jgi:NAD(P)-dependent dehydrogenase (short-subunit alcohol dehydrogenase family)